MRTSVRKMAATAGALAGTLAAMLSCSVAPASTISKNIPGAIRHPVNEAAKAVGADHPTPHHHYVRTHTVRYRRYERYSTHRAHRSRHHRMRRHHSR